MDRPARDFALETFAGRALLEVMSWEGLPWQADHGNGRPPAPGIMTPTFARRKIDGILLEAENVLRPAEMERLRGVVERVFPQASIDEAMARLQR